MNVIKQYKKNIFPIKGRFWTLLITCICILSFSNNLQAQTLEATHNSVNASHTAEEEEGKYEEKHKNSAWFKAMSKPNANYFKVKSEFDKYFGTHQWETSKPRQLGESWLKTRIYYLDKDCKVQEEPPFDASKRIVKRSMTVNTTTTVGSWTMLGPVNSYGASQYASPYNHGGYVYLNRIDPTNSSKVFASFVTGGLWMTSDGGTNWTLTDANMPDDHYYDLDVCIGNPMIVYAISKTHVIKSVDGGLTYTTTGLSTTTHSGTGRDIAVSPTDPNIVIARWDDKILRTTDGGATWTTITTGLPGYVIFDSSPISEMVDWSTTNNSVVYFLSTSHNDKVEVYRSGDAGLTFTLLQTITVEAPANGLVVGWTKLFLPSNNTTHFYVAIGSGDSQNQHHSVHMYKLDNSTGAIASSKINMATGIDKNSVHHGDIVMDRTNENNIVFGGYSQKAVHYSTDNGDTFTFEDVDKTHADIRSIDMVGGNVAIGSDGELSWSSDNGATYNTISNPISNHECWGFGSAFKSDVIAMGANHGPVMIKESHNGFDWFNGYGADQQNTDVNPLDDRYIQTRGYNQRRIFRTGPHTIESQNSLIDIGGLTYFNNIHYHPNLYYTLITHHAGGFPTGNPNLATWKNSLLRSDDQGTTVSIVKTFTDQVFREKICMKNPKAIYVVVGLSNNNLWKTLDGGTSWTNVTPSLAESSNQTHISDIAVSDSDPNEVWITYSSVQSSCKVVKSTDGGSSWTNITGSLSTWPTERLRHQRGSNGLVYTGNKDGVFYRDNTMSDWALLGNGLPMMDVRWIFINYNEGKLKIGTSRGAWSHDLAQSSPPQAQIAADRQKVDCPNLIKVQFRDYSTVRNASATWAWSFPGGTPSTSNLENPLISYAGSPDGLYSVSLTVTDALGTSSQTLTDFIELTGSSSGCNVDTVPGKMLTIVTNTEDAQTPNGLNITTNTITMSCWIKPNGVISGNPGLITTSSGTATGLVVRQGGVGYVWGNHSYSWGYTSGLTVPTGEWSHVAMVIKPGSATMYLNGVAAENTNHGSDAIGFNHSIHFGSDRGHTNDHFIGSMDEVCIYNRALTTAEIRNLMNLTKNNPNAGSLPQTDASLIAYYQINEEPGSPLFDKAGGNHATLVGGATNSEVSTAPVGGGKFQSMPVTSGGLKDFNVPGVELTFPAAGTYPDGDVVVSRLNVPSDQLAGTNILPAAPKSYYVIRNYGTNSTFTSLTSVKYKNVQGTTNQMATAPQNIKLFKRSSNQEGNSWSTPIGSATTVTNSSGVGTAEFATNIDLTSFSQFSIVSDVDLPVKLTSFMASKTRNDEVLLKWESASEVNFDRYELEKSGNAVSFEKLTTIDQKEEMRYTFTDVDPKAGNNYYRLKMIDLDGTIEYSEVRLVNFQSNLKYSLYPNPSSSGELAIKFDGIDHNARVGITVTNSNGQLVKSIYLNDVQDNTFYKTFVTETPGLYYVRIVLSTGQRFVEKFIIGNSNMQLKMLILL